MMGLRLISIAKDGGVVGATLVVAPDDRRFHQWITWPARFFHTLFRGE
jgi:hypothetical protein